MQFPTDWLSHAQSASRGKIIHLTCCRALHAIFGQWAATVPSRSNSPPFLQSSRAIANHDVGNRTAESSVIMPPKSHRRHPMWHLGHVPNLETILSRWLYTVYPSVQQTKGHRTFDPCSSVSKSERPKNANSTPTFLSRCLSLLSCIIATLLVFPLPLCFAFALVQPCGRSRSSSMSSSN